MTEIKILLRLLARCTNIRNSVISIYLYRVIIGERIRYTDDVDELYESEVEADADDFGEVTHWSDEWVVTVEEIVDKTHFIVAAKT